jgi:hypothetical protein
MEADWGDVVADDAAEQSQRAAAEDQVGCLAGTLSWGEYHDLLTAAGFSSIRITATRQAGEGLHSAIIQAVKPATRPSRWPARSERNADRTYDRQPRPCRAGHLPSRH